MAWRKRGSIKGPKGDPGDTRVVLARTALSSNSSGIGSVQLPAAGLVLSITPRTTNVVVTDVAVNAQNLASITFKKFNPSLIGGLLATLFATSTGVVSFDITACTPTPSA